ncbi:MAG: cytochrome c [Cyclobacteriaceae bacterium]
MATDTHDSRFTTDDMIKNILIAFICLILLAGCGGHGNSPGTEFAPNMYHSVPYDPFTQIKDWDAGRLVTSIEYPEYEDFDKGHAEFHNSNLFNPDHMNMRTPPANTVRRNPQGWLPYRLPNDSTGLRMANSLRNPLDSTAGVVAAGKALYEMYCDHCHGPKGAGDGKVATGVTIDGKEKSAYAGVPSYQSDALKNITEGHIFHVITYGKNLMWPHGSQVNVEDRWRIAKYVKTLQK